MILLAKSHKPQRASTSMSSTIFSAQELHQFSSILWSISRYFQSWILDQNYSKKGKTFWLVKLKATFPWEKVKRGFTLLSEEVKGWDTPLVSEVTSPPKTIPSPEVKVSTHPPSEVQRSTPTPGVKAAATHPSEISSSIFFFSTSLCPIVKEFLLQVHLPFLKERHFRWM